MYFVLILMIFSSTQNYKSFYFLLVKRFARLCFKLLDEVVCLPINVKSPVYLAVLLRNLFYIMAGLLINLVLIRRVDHMCLFLCQLLKDCLTIQSH